MFSMPAHRTKKVFQCQTWVDILPISTTSISSADFCCYFPPAESKLQHWSTVVSMAWKSRRRQGPKIPPNYHSSLQQPNYLQYLKSCLLEIVDKETSLARQNLWLYRDLYFSFCNLWRQQHCSGRQPEKGCVLQNRDHTLRPTPAS